jgi:tetratricopeptide (TPR) repeat protein
MDIPERITHYRILDKLGEGGMGVVYVAEGERLGRRVALKLLRRDPSEPNAGARLNREARVAASVSHPAICQVFDLGEWEHQPFLVMELVEGESLAARLVRGPIPTLETLRIALSIHDELAQRVVTSLPLVARDRERKPNIGSASAKGFDLYLRGMQLRMETSSWRQARALFDRCVALDPTFAPAWAELGRLDRVIGKYEDQALQVRAEAALQRALELDSDNGAAHHYYAQLEIDLGRVEAALTRLLERVRQRRAEPQVYAALVQACRYAGLLAESVAAHRQAGRLDPTVSTSVLHTYYMQRDYDRALEEGPRSSDPFEARVLGAMGRDADAIKAARREEDRYTALPLLRSFSSGLRAALEGKTEEALTALVPFDTIVFNDGEALFYVAEIYAKLGIVDRALMMLMRAVDEGFACTPAFENDPYLWVVRKTAQWPTLFERVRAKQAVLVDSFVRAGGQTLLGTSRPR